MGKTKKAVTLKKEILTDPLLKKGHAHKTKDKSPHVCPVCRGSCIDVVVCDQGHYGVTYECGKCRGEGVIYE